MTDSDIDIDNSEQDESMQTWTRNNCTTTKQERKRIKTAYEKGLSIANICTSFDLYRNKVYTIQQKVTLIGEIEPGIRGGMKRYET